MRLIKTLFIAINLNGALSDKFFFFCKLFISKFYLLFNFNPKTIQKMKKSNLFRITTILFASSIIISSCGDSKAKEFANSMCNMATEVGLDENLKLDENYIRKNGKKFEKNFLNKSDDFIKLLKEVDKHLKSLDKDQKTAFTKELMKAIIDTKCSDIFFKGIPYHDLDSVIEEMEDELKRDKKRRDNPEPEMPAYDEPAYSEEPVAAPMPEEAENMEY